MNYIMFYNIQLFFNQLYQSKYFEMGIKMFKSGIDLTRAYERKNENPIICLFRYIQQNAYSCIRVQIFGKISRGTLTSSVP